MALATDSIKVLVKVAISSAALCQQFVNRAAVLNVTFLMSPDGVAASNDICTGKASFKAVSTHLTFVPSRAPTVQQSESPTQQPTEVKSKLVTSGFIGFICIVLLIAVLRFHPAFAALFVVAKDKKRGNLYDILVVLSEDEEAILENIRHEDIAFFRRTDITDEAQSLGWMMNATSDLLQKRFEVQFLDQYDLLGQSGLDDSHDGSSIGHAVLGDKLVTKEVYLHEARLQIGMIIKVKPYKDPKPDLSSDSFDLSMSSDISVANSDLDSSAELPHKLKLLPGFHFTSPQKLGRVGASPRAPPSDGYESSDAYMSSKSNGSLGTLSHAGYGFSDNDSTSYVRNYNDGISDDDSEFLSPPKGQQSGFKFGLKHEEYREESDGDESSDSTSIDFPLDTFSVSDGGSEVRRSSQRSNIDSNHKRRSLVRLNAKGFVSKTGSNDADDEIAQSPRQWRRKSTASFMSSISSTSSSKSSTMDPPKDPVLEFSKPRANTSSKKYTFREGGLVDDQPMIKDNKQTKKLQSASGSIHDGLSPRDRVKGRQAMKATTEVSSSRVEDKAHKSALVEVPKEVEEPKVVEQAVQELTATMAETSFDDSRCEAKFDEVSEYKSDDESEASFGHDSTEEKSDGGPWNFGSMNSSVRTFATPDMHYEIEEIEEKDRS